jgi:hypothetical protein
MRRVILMPALVLVAGVWPAVPAAAHSATAAQATAAIGVQADFNNDGFADLAVGVPGEDVGNIPDAGAVNVLYGSASKLTGTGSQIFTQDSPGVPFSAEAGDFFGDALSSGDFNNDGFADLAVGVPGEDVGSIRDAGAVNVLYGSASGLTGTGSQIFTQVGSAPEAGDSFGFALASGDFNNDGFADLAAGAPFENVFTTADAGAVSVLYGSAAKLTATGGQIFTQVGSAPEAGDIFGFALASGDFNNDGFADLAAGAPFENVFTTTDAGAVSVLYGSAAKLTATGGQIFTQDTSGVGSSAEPGDFFGFALASGDFKNDGFADLAVGVPGEDVGSIRDGGAVNALYGSASKLTGTGSQIFTQETSGSSAEPGDDFGFALASGDFNNDGFADLAVGVGGEDVGLIRDAGAVNVLYGSASGLTGTGSQIFTQDTSGVGSSAEPGDFFGDALASGDFNNDGFADLAVGVPGEDVGLIPDAGAVNVLYGSASKLTGTGSQIFTQDSPGVPFSAEPGDFFGGALAAGDPHASTAAAASSPAGSSAPRTARR